MLIDSIGSTAAAVAIGQLIDQKKINRLIFEGVFQAGRQSHVKKRRIPLNSDIVFAATVPLFAKIDFIAGKIICFQALFVHSQSMFGIFFKK